MPAELKEKLLGEFGLDTDDPDILRLRSQVEYDSPRLGGQLRDYLAHQKTNFNVSDAIKLLRLVRDTPGWRKQLDHLVHLTRVELCLYDWIQFVEEVGFVIPEDFVAKAKEYFPDMEEELLKWLDTNEESVGSILRGSQIMLGGRGVVPWFSGTVLGHPRKEDPTDRAEAQRKLNELIEEWDEIGSAYGEARRTAMVLREQI